MISKINLGNLDAHYYQVTLPKFAVALIPLAFLAITLSNFSNFDGVFSMSFVLKNYWASKFALSSSVSGADISLSKGHDHVFVKHLGARGRVSCGNGNTSCATWSRSFLILVRFHFYAIKEPFINDISKILTFFDPPYPALV